MLAAHRQATQSTCQEIVQRIERTRRERSVQQSERLSTLNRLFQCDASKAPIQCWSMPVRGPLTAVLVAFATGNLLSGAELRIRISHGQDNPRVQPFHITLEPSTPGCSLNRVRVSGDHSNAAQHGVWTGDAGGGQIATVSFTLIYRDEDSSEESR